MLDVYRKASPLTIKALEMAIIEVGEALKEDWTKENASMHCIFARRHIELKRLLSEIENDVETK